MKAHAFDCQTLIIAFAPGDVSSATIIGEVLAETRGKASSRLHRRRQGKPPTGKSNKSLRKEMEAL